MSASPNISTEATNNGLLQSFADGGAGMDTVARPQLQVNDPKYVPTSSQFEDGSSLKLNALSCGDPKSMSFADLEATCMVRRQMNRGSNYVSPCGLTFSGCVTC
jgi:hypothetical protein